jgi:hypothetical protein
MNRTPRALLKGASSILSEGGSLTSNGVEYESREAKDAIKGFVKDENKMKVDSVAKVSSEVKEKIDKPSPVSKEPLIITKKVLQVVDTRSISSVPLRKARSGRTYFEAYLILLNIFLFLGILFTVSSVSFAIYTKQNELSSSPVLFEDIFDSISLKFSSVWLNINFYFANFNFSETKEFLIQYGSDFIANFSDNATDLFDALNKFIQDLMVNFPVYATDFTNSALDSAAILYDDSISFLTSMFPN